MRNIETSNHEVTSIPIAVEWRYLDRKSEYWDTTVIKSFLSKVGRNGSLIGIDYTNLQYLVDCVVSSLRTLLPDTQDTVCIVVSIPSGPYLPIAITAVHQMNNDGTTVPPVCMVPIDPSDGRERVKRMLHTVYPSVLLTATQSDAEFLKDLLPQNHDAQVIDQVYTSDHCNIVDVKALIAERLRLTKPLTTNNIAVAPSSVLTDNRLSHIVFTSGTTGNPKGCVSSMKSLRHYIQAKNTEHRIWTSSKVLLASALSFDPCLSDILATFSAGATLVIACRKEMQTDFFNLTQSTQITHILCTPTLWSNITYGIEPVDLPSLELIALGGEPISRRIVNVWGNETNSCELWATYGVTEACVYQSMGQIMRESPVGKGQFVGKPFPGMQALIWDDENKVTTTSGEGEILLLGEQLDSRSRYFARKDLSREKFIEVDGKIAYRTGDRGTIEKESGSLRIIGRIQGDRMVKFNGIRIELGEIEAAVLDDEQISIIQDAIVSAKRENGDDDSISVTKLILFCVLTPTALKEVGISLSDLTRGVTCTEGPLLELLRHRCTAKARVQPSHIIFIERIPNSPTGKRDPRALPDLSQILSLASKNGSKILLKDYGRCGVVLAKAVIECLNMKAEQSCLLTTSISFSALGGDSLAATRIIRDLYARHHKVDYSRNLGGKFGTFDGAFNVSKLLATRSLGEYVDWLDTNGVLLDVNHESSKRKIEDTTLSDEREMDAPASRLNDALFEACTQSMTTVALALLREGANPNFAETKTRLGKTSGRNERRQTFASTPMHVAAIQGNSELIHHLISFGAKCNVPDAAGVFPIHLVALGTPDPYSKEDDLGRIECMKALLEAGSLLTMKDLNKQSILHAVARSGKVDLLKYILTLWKEQVLTDSHTQLARSLDWLDHWYRTPVHWAVLNGKVAALKILLEAGCSPTPYKAKVVKTSSIASESPLEICERVHGNSELGKEIRDLLENYSMK